MTGHLVLSTVHARDTINALTRLIDLGIPPYLLAATLRGVVSQRLARKLCPHCLVATDPDEKLIQQLIPGYKITTGAQVREPTGCSHCHGTGYQGRRALFEILPISDAMQPLINKQADEDQLRALARRENLESLEQVALDHYLRGELGREALLALASEIS